MKLQDELKSFMKLQDELKVKIFKPSLLQAYPNPTA